MTLTTLVEEIGDNRSRWVSKCPEPQEIFSYELYHENSILLPGIAYICDHISLPDTAPSGISFLCAGIPGCSADRQGENNIISFSGDVTSLLIKVGSVMSVEHRLQADKQSLMDALDSGGLQHLIDVAYEKLKNPIILIDSAYRQLAMSKPVIENRPDLERQRRLGYVEDFNIDEMKQSRIYENARMTKYPYYSAKSVDYINNTAWLHTLIYVYGIEAALLSVMEYEHDFAHYDNEIVCFLSKLIAIELQKNDFYKDNRVLTHSLLMADLLESKLSDNTMLIRAHHLGWALSDEMYIMTIFDRNYGMFDQKARLICDQIQGLCKNSRWVIWENKIVFILIFGKNDDPLSLWSTLKEYLEKNKLTAAVSDRFSDLNTVRFRYSQCEAAYDLGSRLDHGSLLYFYGDYSLHHIGAVALEKLLSPVFFHPGVIAMDKYDKEKNSHLLATVKEYLSFSDPGTVAGRLFIHKNTLLYRINKAKELFGFDFNSGYEKMRVFLTILLMEL